MSRAIELPELIPAPLVRDLILETEALEALVGTAGDPWRLMVSGGGVRGHEAGGHHTQDDPMRAALLDHHRRDPLSERDLFFWYHSVTRTAIEAALGRPSALERLECHLASVPVRADLERRTGVPVPSGSPLTLSLTRFGPGAFLAPHTDHVADGGTYALTVILFLNEDWHPYYGGQLVLWEGGRDSARAGMGGNGGWRTLEPTARRFVVFEPTDETDHYVVTVHPCAPRPRYAVSGWFHREPLKPSQTAEKV